MGRITSKKRKNYIINGDMQIAQRGASFNSIANGQYTMDRFEYSKAGSVIHNLTQDTDVPTFAQAGYLFKNSLRLNLTTPDTSIAAGDYCFFKQSIEGYNFADLAQKPFTVSFWVKATLTGTYCVAFGNSGGDRSYVAEYTINVSNTWEYKTITVVASPSAGTWNYTNGIGLNVRFIIASGSTFQTTAGSWQTGVFLSTSNQVNGVNTGSTDFRITGVMLNEGFNAQPFRTFGENIQAEVAACQRFFCKSSPLNDIINPTTGYATFVTFASNSGNTSASFINFAVEMRNQPTLQVYDLAGTAGRITFADAGGNRISNTVPPSTANISTRGFSYIAGGVGSTSQGFGILNFTADAEL